MSRKVRPNSMEHLERRVILSVSLSLGSSQTPSAATPNNLSQQDSAYQSEMSLVVNPENPLEIAGLSHNINAQGDRQVELFYSVNGGTSWNRQLIDGTVDGFSGTRFDPTLVFDANGDLYASYGVDNDVDVGVRLVVGQMTDLAEGFDRFVTVDAGNNGNGLFSPAVSGPKKTEMFDSQANANDPMAVI